ncbi:hypothetical protein B0H19DRAFT_122742 [Mycena capillaripes]|nr:hypothetical protein B0H19DRAFT_122742 [Mycena capillaripes]
MVSTSASTASTSASASRSITATSTPVRAQAPAPAAQPQKWQPQQSVKPISSVPRHMQPTGLQTPITTPGHERKVSFAPQVQTKPLQGQMPPPPVPVAEDGGDDSFGFFSDDDAFLAAVDMGEGDLGQPIDFEEGAEGSTVSSGDEERAFEAVPARAPEAKQPADRYGPMGGRTGQGGRHAQQQSGAMDPPPNPPPQQKVYVANPSGVNSNPASRAGAAQPLSGGSSAPSRPSGNVVSSASSAGSTSRALAIANAQSERSTSNQNQKPAATPPAGDASGSAAASAAPPAKRASTPSVGGFHFPPGMPVRTSSSGLSPC